MIPIIPALALAFVSLLCSAFVILRIVIPILPPHPFSRRVAPSEFGLPNFRSLSPADKGHLWLASLDLFALLIFTWHALNDYIAPPIANIALDPASTARLWFAITVRQTCLLVVASLTLLHIRMGQSVSFGYKHWMMWAPTALLTATSTIAAAVVAGGGVASFFVGLLAYTATIAVLSSIAFGCLVGTLVIIKRNLAAINDAVDPWPPVRQVEEKPRPSYATEEIDALRDGASWITSNASVGSRHNSVSAWSFSTHHTSHHGHSASHGRAHPALASNPSILPKSSYWFSSSTPADANVPPVPPLPSPYGPLSPTAQELSDPDPFARIPTPVPDHPRYRNGSQTSWLTSDAESQASLSAWSYPTTHRTVPASVGNASSPDLNTQLLPAAPKSRPATPAMADAQVLGGYGYTGGTAEKGLAALAAPPGTTLDISLYRGIGWLTMVWLPLGLAMPFMINGALNAPSSALASLLLTLSITLSSPILALNILLRSPIPIPTGLFDARNELPTHLVRGPSPAGSETLYKGSHEYKRSNSCSVATVVEGRRSGDVWITKGDAVDGKGKVSRAISMLAPKPKLSVLPSEEVDDGQFTPPLPLQMDASSLVFPVNQTPRSEMSAELGRIRKISRASSRHYSADEGLAFQSHIMIAQRHYSALAQTVVISGSPDKGPVESPFIALGALASGATAENAPRQLAHLRSRSVSSVSGPKTPTDGSFNVSGPPPAFPLPPTPPNVRAARLAKLKHKKSFSSGFSFGPVDDMNEIDALTAGVLPILVPGLKVGRNMKIKEGDYSPPGTWSKNAAAKAAKQMLKEFGEYARDSDFSSPEMHSTPARQRHPRGRKNSHKNHWSLPSFGKEGVQSLATWSAEIKGALENKIGHYVSTPGSVDLARRSTICGGENIADSAPHQPLSAVAEEDEGRPSSRATTLGRAMSTRSLGLRAEVPHGVNTARSSIALPPSAASTVTLFELDTDEFEAGLKSAGPQAESTPHNSVSQKPTSKHRPPALTLAERHSNAAHRRSSIVYIKSDDHESMPDPTTAPTPNSSSRTTLAQWSSRAVRPLMPKASKLQRKVSGASSSERSAGSPGRGLRPLSLLQERDSNIQTASPVSDSTRPLTAGKKQKARLVVANQDENADPNSGARSRNLKPLQLARSDTAKVRGILRKKEVLPDVVVRPPSTGEHLGYAYSFRDD